MTHNELANAIAESVARRLTADAHTARVYWTHAASLAAPALEKATPEQAARVVDAIALNGLVTVLTAAKPLSKGALRDAAAAATSAALERIKP